MLEDTLPAISENKASGEIAELYDDIRATLNVSAINYVWRHIATIDGGLRWAWEAARPMFVSGRVEREGEHLQAQLSYPKLSHLSDSVLSLVGVDREGRDAIVAILDTYNRGNLLNMLALSALVVEPAKPPSGNSTQADLPFTAAPLPPIPEMIDLSDEVRDQVLALNGLGAKPGPNRVVASIYKHIALWPGYLSLSWVQLAPMHADGSLLRSVEDTRVKARRYAAYLAADLGPRPPGPVADRVRSTVVEFTDTAIVRMIPIGQMLRQSLSA